MAGNEQKTALARTLQAIGLNAAKLAIQITGKALPARVQSKQGSIVTVQFALKNIPWTLPNVTVPIFGPEYIRYPVQKGCQGVVFPADTLLGGVTGLGTGDPDLTQPANLTSLVFFPIGNVGFPAADPNTLILYGEPGVLIKDKTGAAQVNVSSNGITLSFSGHTVVLDSAGVHIEGKLFLTHEHTGVQSGTLTTGGVQ